MPTTDSLNIQISANTGNAATNILDTANALHKLENSAKSADNDVSILVHGMADAASKMAGISSDISISAAGLASFQSNIDAVSATILGVNDRFDKLNGSLQQSNTVFEDAASSVNVLSSASESSASALNSIVSATDGFAGKMEDLKSSTTETSEGMSDLQKELYDTLSTLRGFSDNLGNAGNYAEEASRKIYELSERVRSMPTQQPLALAEGFKKVKSVVATLGIAKFVKDSNDAYETQMTNELKLTAHMKHRMNATDDEIKSIKELASAQQKIGVIGDEIQLAGAQQLTTYARQSSTLKTLIPAMNNLIAQNAGYEASVSDATSAADMLGRALNGQYTSLKRMGISFTAAQENILKYGTEEQKAAVLAETINRKVGNMNELLAQTPTGKYKQLQNELGDLQEEIGATFQPLTASIVPVIRGAMETLRVPILNVSRGISVIGQAIASVDNPAVRGIALAAAGIAVLHKLKAVIGGTSAGLLLLGLAIAAVTGSVVQQQDNIGDIVKDAYNGAAEGIGSATDAMAGFDEEAANTQKTLNRLAGFDTITKLSGNNATGSLVSSMLGADWQTEFEQAKSDANDLKDIVNGIGGEKETTVKFTDAEARHRITRFETDATTVMNNLGNIDVMYAPLERMTKDIEDLLNANGLDGTGFVNFWKGVGDEVYKALTNQDSGFYKALREWDAAMIDFKPGGIDIGKVFGDSLYGITNSKEIVESGQGYEYAQKLIDEAPDLFGVKSILKPIYNATWGKQLENAVTRDSFNEMDYRLLIRKYLSEGMTADYAYSKALKDFAGDNFENFTTWLNNYVNPSDRSWFTDVNTTEVYRQKLVAAGEIPANVVNDKQTVTPQTTSYVDVPLRSTANNTDSSSDQAASQVNVYFEGEQLDPSRYETDNGKNR